ncbi:hypothetical protein Y032_0002g1007 [Ancylostoma ceylanicum]|uniref:Uncharacterized protein n=1 Tax=Ancylostoma ceylanicum TaxID=53326 RepID=A0A016W048_9BILA|nr:hypothetical protein Y032_0002g1007 [Ancylostoma ceylanicum]
MMQSVFCDFCKQLKAQSAKISASRHLSTHKSIDDDCNRMNSLLPECMGLMLNDCDIPGLPEGQMLNLVAAR